MLSPFDWSKLAAALRREYQALTMQPSGAGGKHVRQGVLGQGKTGHVGRV